MPVLRLFAAARQAAGTGRDQVSGATVGEVLAVARERYGDEFAMVLGNSRVWVNGSPVDDHEVVVADDDEVAVLPPVSGGGG